MALTQVPIELSSTPGIVDNSNATAITIDSSENVGIGISSPFGTATNRTALSVNGTNDVSLNVGTGGSQRAYLYADSTFARVSTIGSIPLQLGTNDTERMRILPTGGITFNGDTTQANALDDYEEGTWTAEFNIPSGSVTYHASSGVYTKIGRMIHVNAWVYVNALSSPSGTLTLTLPVANQGNARASQVNVVNRWTGVTGQIGCWLSNNSRSLNFVTLNNGSMGASALNGTNMQTNCEMYINFSYET